MERMFYDAISFNPARFNQPLDKWDVSNVGHVPMFQLLRIDLTKEMLERARDCYDNDDTMKSDLDFIFCNVILKNDENS